MQNNYFVTVFAWIVAAIFIYAGMSKIVAPADFFIDIQNFRLLPMWAVTAVAVILPWWEIGAGIALLVPTWRQAGAGIAFLLTIGFSIAVSSAIARGLDISCGCFGNASNKVGFITLSFDIAILIGASIVLFFEGHRIQDSNS